MNEDRLTNKPKTDLFIEYINETTIDIIDAIHSNDILPMEQKLDLIGKIIDRYKKSKAA